MRIAIENEWVDFDAGKIIKINNRQYYNNKQITNKSTIKIICRNCKKEHMVSLKKYKVRENQEELCSKCSTQLNRNKEKIKEKSKQTNLKKYGVENPWQSEEIREKIRQTNLKRYGRTNIGQFGTPEHRNAMIRKYGVDHNMKLKIFVDKARQTNLKKYGVEIPYLFGSEEFKQNMIDKYGIDNPIKLKEIQEKVKQTNINRYGKPYIMQNDTLKERFKKSMIEKYGFPWSGQNKKLFEKTMKTSKKINYYTTKYNRKISYQSSYEYDFILACEELNIDVKNGPPVAYFFEEREHQYFIDFETDKYIVEIKGSHIWYEKDLKSGKIDAKNKKAIEYAKENNKKFVFLLDKKNYNDVLGDLYGC